MSRKTMSDGFASTLGKALGITLALGALFLAAGELPALKRYLHIVRLAKDGAKSRATVMSNGEPRAKPPSEHGAVGGAVGRA